MRFRTLSLSLLVLLPCLAVAEDNTPQDKSSTAPLDNAIVRAGENRGEIQAALDKVPDSQKASMEFLVANMPDVDLQALKADFLLENVREAQLAMEAAPWKDVVPQEIFLNNVLPHISISERRDSWRKDFRERFTPMVKEAKTPGEAAAILNNKIFPLLKVKYSTKRRRADQSPYESMETGLASCTGLSVLLIDACRAVGVPARFVGTPLWTNKSGNHSWVEVWDDGWHFTGAAEPTGNQLDKAWFTGRAATAIRDEPMHAIYAVSYKKTPLHFPMVWAGQKSAVFGLNVTDRYTARKEEIPDGYVQALFRIYKQNGDRCACKVTVLSGGKPVFEGKSKDERFDANDHLVANVKKGEEYEVEIEHDGGKIRKKIKVDAGEKIFSYQLKP
jgi:hypothetical protein